MPFVHVYHPMEFSNREELEKVSNKIHCSLVEHFKIPKNDYFQMFIPYPSNQFYFNTFYLLDDGEQRSERMMYISITCGPGRTIDQKLRLYQSISNAISNQLNISTSDIFITLNETPPENWSFGQGKAQMVKFMEGKEE